MELKDLVEDYNKLKAQLALDLVPGPAVQLQRDRKNTIKRRLPIIERDYRAVFRTKVVPVVVVGDKAKELVDKISEEAPGTLAYNGDSLFDEVVKRLPIEAKNGRMTAKHVVDIISSVFEEVATDMDIASYPQILYKHKMGIDIKTEEDTKDLVKSILMETLGGQVMLEFNLVNAAQISLENNFAGKKIPLFLYTSDVAVSNEYTKNYTASVLTAGSVSGKLNQSAFASLTEVDADNVNKLLNKLKKELSKK